MEKPHQLVGAWILGHAYPLSIKSEKEASCTCELEPKLLSSQYHGAPYVCKFQQFRIHGAVRLAPLLPYKKSSSRRLHHGPPVTSWGKLAVEISAPQTRCNHGCQNTLQQYYDLA